MPHGTGFIRAGMILSFASRLLWLIRRASKFQLSNSASVIPSLKRTVYHKLAIAPLNRFFKTPDMFKILLIGLYWLSDVCMAGSTAQDWAKLTMPTRQTAPQSIGTYTSGCLVGAATLPVSGTGYQVMRLSRNQIGR